MHLVDSALDIKPIDITDLLSQPLEIQKAIIKKEFVIIEGVDLIQKIQHWHSILLEQSKEPPLKKAKQIKFT